jgi:FkbM family methyltransferase
MKRTDFHSTACRNLGPLPYLYFAFQKRMPYRGPFKLFSKNLDFPVKVRPETSDLSVFYQIMIFDEYRCVAGLKSPELIIDLGANVGYSSAYFLSRFKNSRVIAVEPDPSNFRELQNNLLPYRSRAIAVQAAVWPHSEMLLLNHPGQGEEWGISIRPSENGTVRAITVPELISMSGAQRISLLKIDIEGSEIDLFRSDTTWLRQVDNIVIELHGDEARDTFFCKIDKSRFEISTCDELTVCLSRLI